MQEKKRELANQTIEGGAKSGAGKLGMKEILQLFRHDAEHAPRTSAVSNDLGSNPRILKERLSGGSSQGSSRETSVARKVTPQNGRVPGSFSQEDQVYGRRW